MVNRPSNRAHTSRLARRPVVIPETLTADVLKVLSSLNCPSPRSLYLKDQVLSKFVSDETDPASVREQRAIDKWLFTETMNEATEHRLIVTSGDYHLLPHVTLSRFVSFCRSLISDTIGDTVPVDALFGGFSGGATTTRSRASSHPAEKYLGLAEITPAAYPWFETVLLESRSWLLESHALDIRLCEGNKMFTVPKTTVIDRCACKEPDLNMYLQKGVGNHFRRCLRSRGINLNDQTVNQQLARVGSIDGSLATLDLSSASDSITCEVVHMLLPDLWASCLMDLRSPFTMIGDYQHKNVMISSMGNGFTFELESLLFWALAKTTAYMLGVRGTISVYGDDIIVPTVLADPLIRVLQFFGFSVNEDKSFTSGPFRESCGGHYLNGIDISPFYLRRPVKTLHDVIVLANHIRKWSHVDGIHVLDPTLEPLWLRLRDLVPQVLRGGDDLEDNTRLVSVDRPHSRLSMMTKSIDTGLGGYLLWLDSCGDRRLPSSVQTSVKTVDTGIFRFRRCPGGIRYQTSIFISELDTGPEHAG